MPRNVLTGWQALLILVMRPSVTLASDFSGLVWYAAAYLLGCPIAGIATTWTLEALTKKKWCWWLAPVFIGMYFGIWTLIEYNVDS